MDENSLNMCFVHTMYTQSYVSPMFMDVNMYPHIQKTLCVHMCINNISYTQTHTHTRVRTHTHYIYKYYLYNYIQLHTNRYVFFLYYR